MPNCETWTAWNDISRLVDIAFGLALLADYDSADSITDPAEQEAARRAPMAAARVLLQQAAELLPQIEPRDLGEKA